MPTNVAQDIRPGHLASEEEGYHQLSRLGAKDLERDVEQTQRQQEAGIQLSVVTSVVTACRCTCSASRYIESGGRCNLTRIQGRVQRGRVVSTSH